MEAIAAVTEPALDLASDLRAKLGHVVLPTCEVAAPAGKALPIGEVAPPTAQVALPSAEVDLLADEIAELSAHLDAATHRLLTLIRRFDACSGWYRQGALSCAAWLSWRIGLDLCAAREKVRVARALGSLPLIDEALRRGQVSYSKVRALTRVATAENEALLLEMARSATAAQLDGSAAATVVP